MSEIVEQFVEFDKYCNKCEYKDLENFKSPCNECLESPVNIYTTRPIKFKEQEKKEEKKEEKKDL